MANPNMFGASSLLATAQTAAININVIPASDSEFSASGTATGSIPQPIDITHQRPSHAMFNNGRFRRESLAHSQGMGGVSWGSVTIGSWLKDEVMMSTSYGQNQNAQAPHLGQYYAGNALINPRRGLMRHHTALPPTHSSYLPDLEAHFCKDYSCCGEHLPTLHDLLRHYEEAHISPSPPTDNDPLMHSNRSNHINNMHNIMETVSTNDVFLNNNQGDREDPHAHEMSQALRPGNIQQRQNNSLHPNSHQQQASRASQLPIRNNAAGHQSFNLTQGQDLGSGAVGQQHQLPPHKQSHQAQAHGRTLPPRRMNIPHPAQRLGMPMLVDDEEAMYIDDPARHLYVMENDEHKPYKCPVIGCEKTYKNQNGLKYHRLHGHQGQTLKENADGTISIIDPESNTPYLDGAGMEKDKPYRCEVCGKRYKNLNGLKYHRGHTTH